MTAGVPEPGLFVGQVTHRRVRPFRHRFAYRVISLLVDPLDPRRGFGGLPWFSHDRFNLIAFHQADHGPGGQLADWLTERRREAGIPEDGPVRLLCFPRVWGYVFNPLSVYFCYRSDGRLAGLIHEVSNTFGERHWYVAAVEDKPGEPVRHRHEKRFHVSPLLERSGTYRFGVHPPGDSLSLFIRLGDEDGPTMVATLQSRRIAAAQGALIARLARDPVVTLKIMAAIHWQALRLLIKGARFHRRPPQQVSRISLPIPQDR